MMLESIKIKMQKFNSLTSIPAYLPIVNIDTDMIIPKPHHKINFQSLNTWQLTSPSLLVVTQSPTFLSLENLPSIIDPSLLNSVQCPSI